MNKAFVYKDSSMQGMELTFKDVDGKKGIVTGYFSAFNNVDSDGDIIRRGAFTKSIRENGPLSTRPRIKHLMNHDTRSPIGNITILEEHDRGLYYESKVGTHNLGQDFIKMVESGLITEHSVGMRIIKRNQIQDYENYTKNPSLGMWDITEAQLWEGSSLSAWGANPLTPLINMKSEMQEEAISKRIDLICKSLRSGTMTDEMFDNLEIELRQLQQFALDLLSKSKDKTTEPEDSTLPNVKVASTAIDNFINSLK